MSRNIPEKLLRVAYSSPCNTQQNPPVDTGDRNSRATSLQQPSLKALALRVLARSDRATSAKQPRNKCIESSQQAADAIDATSQSPARPKYCVVHFHLSGDPPGMWPTAMGPDKEELITDICARYGDRLDGIRPRE